MNKFTVFLALVITLSNSAGLFADNGKALVGGTLINGALADAYVLIPEYGAGTLAKYIPLAHDAIANALAINPESAGALTTSAYIKFMYDYDLVGAKADFEKATAIDPGYATARQWHGELLAVQGQMDAALDELRVARKADPLAPIMPFAMCWFLSSSDRWEEAFTYCQEALTLNPRCQAAINSLAYLNLRAGRFDQARAHYHEWATVIDYDPATDLAVVDALENPALKDKALAKIAQDDVMGGIPEGRGRSASTQPLPICAVV